MNQKITLSVMQHLINEIETGKYRNKKLQRTKFMRLYKQEI